MSDEQKNVDDGKRWQVDYDCNLVWEQTSKSNTNLNELKNDMVSKNWTICSFLFRYKSVVYIVLVKRFVGKEKRVNQYALV